MADETKMSVTQFPECVKVLKAELSKLVREMQTNIEWQRAMQDEEAKLKERLEDLKRQVLQLEQRGLTLAGDISDMGDREMVESVLAPLPKNLKDLVTHLVHDSTPSEELQAKVAHEQRIFNARAVADCTLMCRTIGALLDLPKGRDYAWVKTQLLAILDGGFPFMRISDAPATSGTAVK